ncbi:hypothetical protein D3C75_816050 [compost metagenome]
MGPSALQAAQRSPQRPAYAAGTGRGPPPKAAAAGHRLRRRGQALRQRPFRGFRFGNPRQPGSRCPPQQPSQNARPPASPPKPKRTGLPAGPPAGPPVKPSAGPPAGPSAEPPAIPRPAPTRPIADRRANRSYCCNNGIPCHSRVPPAQPHRGFPVKALYSKTHRQRLSGFAPDAAAGSLRFVPSCVESSRPFTSFIFDLLLCQYKTPACE